ncbi:neprosin family prolyl endopeptidase [Hamadaea tsunoensis]|uniref:neprosin family prolyl endopeptidase n=1 Tax=Hamadaea tsunoensis TaxID=53368 RepID=UPI00040527C1|nr:neprosin family prolyl endopeptidase [Hamadaea tsunoensis]
MSRGSLSRRAYAAALFLAAAGLVAGGVPAQAAPVSAGSTPVSTAGGFQSFSGFLTEVAGHGYADYAKAGRTGAVTSSASFEQMRSYVLDAYRGVVVDHSYVDNGSYFDCVRTETQPSVRDLGIKQLATPPAPQAAGTPKDAVPATQTANAGRLDAYGNSTVCGAGTIPMQRLSIERLTAYPTLAGFLAKGPAGSNPSASTDRASTNGSSTNANAHRYGVGYQYVNNHGGNSWLNLWNPSGEFTLSQQWYVDGSQTVEGGWVHYPGKFGNNAVLFIFWTPDNYVHGCYNLDCSGFVQTSSAFTLGGAWSNYSTSGGGQYGFGLQWKYYAGNWWLYIQGTAIGYYPGTIYGTGNMRYGNATLAEAGGETYTGGTNWPQMGSGSWPSSGWTYAAYQNTVFYIDRSDVSQWSVLNSIITNPACYSISITPWQSGGSWGTYFYYGGPGGYC